MTKECSNNQMTKPASPRAFELWTLGFFRHYGLGISHFAERHGLVIRHSMEMAFYGNTPALPVLIKIIPYSKWHGLAIRGGGGIFAVGSPP